MNTRSTKSGSKKARKKTRVVEAEAPAPEFEAFSLDHFLARNWRFGVAGILVIGAILRLYDLNLKPLHHDEGVNGNFLVRLVREGVYRYDPENYHGPTLYYFSAVIPRVTKLLFGASASETYGLTTFNIRLVTALFGLATVGLVFFLRRRLGTMATLAAALMLAISPGAVYLSRYFIHETLFVFFTLAIVVAVIVAYDHRNASYLIAAAASASLLFATKETAMISAGVLVIALVLTFFYAQMNRRGFAQATANRRGQGGRAPGRWKFLIAELGSQRSVLVSLGLAVIAFVVVYVLLYSSFFTNSKGLYDSFQTFAIWTKTGKVAHVHAPETYLIWLVREESPLLFLGAIGAGITVLKPRNSLALFSALWAFGLIAAYSLIPYKTPWLLLSFIVPLALIAGYAIQAIYEMDQGQIRLVLAILIASIGLATYQTIDLNFFSYDDDRRVYVYAHTKRSTLDLVDRINQIAREESDGQTGITVVSPDYWPLPWYLRNFSRVGYHQRIVATVEPIIIANEIQKPEVETAFGELYEQVRSKAEDGSFELRPGVKLLLYRRRQFPHITQIR